MRSRSEHEHIDEAPTSRELRILTEVEATPDITQRELATRVGIALGLTNVLLRNLAQKGYLRITQSGWKRWLYNLTPEGFSHKVRLTVAYIHRVLNDYQGVRQALREQLAPIALHEESRVAIYGTGEFAELVYLGLKEIRIEEIEVFGPAKSSGSSFLGMTVRDIDTLEPQDYDRVLVASLGNTDEILARLQKRGASPEKLITFFAEARVLEGRNGQ
ncbi:winged helix-turn-helix transcriptional regulator [SAR202 cluster bacterium AD-802-F09_MRT_200m]|nr:winged helix-turn-helix transcriptional regulator [SAR202 cluster bacterium AD-802-F09_MRT_200m]